MFPLFLVLAIHASSAGTHAAVCDRDHPPSNELLLAMARSRFPAVVASTDTAANDVVALILDRSCQLRYDTTLSARGVIENVPDKMAEWFPQVRTGYEVSGMSLFRNGARTWLIVYGVLK